MPAIDPDLLEDARIDRAVILGLMSEKSGEDLKAAVRAIQRRAADIMDEGNLLRTQEAERLHRRLIEVLSEDPYARD